MAETRTVRTVCRSCHGGCGVIAHVSNGKVVKIEGDPESPISFGSLCSKGLAITQIAYHPDRVLYPMKKANGKWKRISWDEGLDTVANKFKEVIAEYGPESIIVGQGTGRDYESPFLPLRQSFRYAQHAHCRSHVLSLPDWHLPDRSRTFSRSSTTPEGPS